MTCIGQSASGVLTREDAERLIREVCVRIAVARYSDRLRAVVLTGSMARSEGTFVPTGCGWCVAGDADFFLVFGSRREVPLDCETAAIASEAEHMLSDLGIEVGIGFAPVTSAYFRQLGPHIATCELREHGQVLWGDSNALAAIPSFAPEAISRVDAWRLLANRMIELLESLWSERKWPQAVSDETTYRAVKLCLDTATSYLVFARRYAPTYRERASDLIRMDDEVRTMATPFPLHEFADFAGDCTRFKLGQCSRFGEPRAITVEKAINYALGLWRWELRDLTGGASADRDSALLRNWMRRQPRRKRLRGWGSVLRRSGWHRSWRDWPRWAWLGLRASPRYWIYGIAAQLLAEFASAHGQLPRGAANRWRRLANRLPRIEPGPASWSWLARQTALNYRLFLETTQA